MENDTPTEAVQTTDCGDQEAMIEPALSKNQKKKLLRRQKILEARPERRKLEREKQKLRRRQAAIERQAQKPEASSNDPLSDSNQSKPRRFYKTMADSTNRHRIVIDLDFQDYMTDSEILKATQQVGRIYSANRRSLEPCQLFISSLRGKVLERFAITNTGHKSWDINQSEKDYLDLFGCDRNDAEAKKQFVYLSGDSESPLPSVEDLRRDESKIFIIGGLVDHNRHKNLCHQRALERGITTARLPVHEHVKLCQRHIFSTYTVFEIMLQVFAYGKSWEEALRLAIPKRKIAPTESSTNSHPEGVND